MSSTQHDLELKRAALLTAGERTTPRWGDEIARQLTMDRAVRITGPETERDFQVAEVGDIVADAMAAVSLVRGDKEVDTPTNRAFAQSIAEQVVAKLAGLSGDTVKISEYDLSVLIEALLVEAGAFDVAKSLVTQRANIPNTKEAATEVKLIRRNGMVVPWSTDKVEIAVRKAFLAQGINSEPAVHVAQAVGDRVLTIGQSYVNIETVQDLVQEELMRGGHFKVAEAYIVYRAQRAMMRAQELASPTKGDDQFALISVVTEDGTNEFWDGEDLRRRIQYAMIGLNLSLSAEKIEVELRRSVSQDIPVQDLRKLIVLNAKSLMERDADFAYFAGRILLTYIYEESLDWNIVRDGVDRLKDAHRRAFAPYLRRGVQIGRLSEDILDYDVDKLAAALDPTADLDFDFLGIQTLYDRYLITDKTNSKTPRRLETPQMFWLRVSMGLFKNESNKEEKAIELYNMYKSRRFCSSTPTLFNSGTKRSQLSSCYLYKVDDSIESIMLRGIAENAFLSKWAGGLGGSWTSVRGTGGYIQGTNGESQGVIPFLKMHNDQLVAVNQGGKRAGSGCAYLESWHNDIFDFLELRRNTGDERRRTHDMNTANWIPDLFMKRMEAREHWTLFRSCDTPELHDLYGKAFEEKYLEYEAKVETGEVWGRKIEALELWKAMLKMLFETGHPWITFKDPCNLRSPQDHVGVVHSSNLCTEITLNTSAEETAVCNLGSIVIDNHLKADGSLDLVKLRETVRVAVRALDNVIDINFYPTEAAKTSNTRHRPVGLGVMGLQYALYKKGVAFASPEAVDFNDEMMEAIAFFAYEASSDLAAERGTYSSYKGSKWDRGLLPQDTLEILERERGVPVEVPRGGRMDWEPLREKIKTQGMRNSNVLAIAPTATIANIMGTSPCIEPVYKNMFVKSNLSGDFVVVNPFMVEELKGRSLWSKEIIDQIKYFDGELANVEGIPDDVKQKYLTAFGIPYTFIIEAAARRQKWIDQSQSVNLFIGQPDMKTLSHMYRLAWRTGLKTTYYLRSLGASNIEKATVAVQKQKSTMVNDAVESDLAAVAFAASENEALASARDSFTLDGTPTKRVFSEAEKLACSIEAMRNGEECEACQ
ncbi:MAG: ribonucleoside-diphosphate reductase subunit alpha [Armatimonadetes bacterium]|nr:ribonucleoside-diphosphate reductase subunit alpha [Armatimonadota bacterium]